jgi:hypothetical protein
MVTGHTVEEGRLRKQHIGRRVEVGDDHTIYSDETLRADDHALMLKIRDSIKALSDPDLFLQLMEQMKAAADSPKAVNPVAAVEELGKTVVLREEERVKVLENFIRDQDYSRWGLLNAVTEVANNSAAYDRAVELEEAGGRILTLSNSAWSQIAEAA